MNTSYAGSASADEKSGDGILAYLPSILWHRRWWILGAILLGTIAGLLAAFLLPASYRSSATLVVESPELPAELIGQKETDVIDERLARLRQQVLSRPDLIQLIENNNLYPVERQRMPLSEVVELMRESTSISPVNADIAPRPGGASTIAFTLQFEYPDPQKAQVVTQDFVERLVKLDATQTAQQAAGTVEFLQDQANSLSSQINTIERQIQSIKAANGMALSTSGITMMPSGGGGGYQAQIAALQRENAQLQSQLTLQSSAADRDPAVVAAEAQLASARAIYSDNHPDVRAAEQRLAEARRFGQQNVARSRNGAAIRNQIASNNAAIASLYSAQNNEQARAGALASAQARAPAISEQVAQLQARADGLRANYQAVATNLLNARGSAKIAEQQRGERLSVVEPPVAAERPTSPNRPLLIAGGIAAGSALAFLIVIFFELVARPIRGVSALEAVTGEPPLVVVPSISHKGGQQLQSPSRKHSGSPVPAS